MWRSRWLNQLPLQHGNKFQGHHFGLEFKVIVSLKWWKECSSSVTSDQILITNIKKKIIGGYVLFLLFLFFSLLYITQHSFFNYNGNKLSFHISVLLVYDSKLQRCFRGIILLPLWHFLYIFALWPQRMHLAGEAGW